jgi:hypothetical protein
MYQDVEDYQIDRESYSSAPESVDFIVDDEPRRNPSSQLMLWMGFGRLPVLARASLDALHDHGRIERRLV